MLRKIGFTLLCVAAAASFTTNAFSIPSHSLQAGITIEYDLPSNEPQLFINYMFWDVEANCKISTQDKSNELFAEAIAKKGKINGVTISAGQTMQVSVHSGDTLKLSAESGAKVKITNLGQHNVKAICTA